MNGDEADVNRQREGKGSAWRWEKGSEEALGERVEVTSDVS